MRTIATLLTLCLALLTSCDGDGPDPTAGTAETATSVEWASPGNELPPLFDFHLHQMENNTDQWMVDLVQPLALFGIAVPGPSGSISLQSDYEINAHSFVFVDTDEEGNLILGDEVLKEIREKLI